MKRILFLLLVYAALYAFPVYAQSGDFKWIFQQFKIHNARISIKGIGQDSSDQLTYNKCIVQVEIDVPNPKTDSIMNEVAEMVNVSSEQIVAAGLLPNTTRYKNGTYYMTFAVNPSFCPGGSRSRPIPVHPDQDAPAQDTASRFLIVIIIGLVMIILSWSKKEKQLMT